MLEIYKTLNTRVPDSQKKSRAGTSDGSVMFVSDDYAQRRLDEIFGPDGWDVENVSVQQLPTFAYEAEERDRNGPSRIVRKTAITMCVALDLIVRFPHGTVVRRAGTGAHTAVFTGDNPGEAIKNCVKAAHTSALKRAAKTLGATFGRGMDKKGVQLHVADLSQMPDRNIPAAAPAIAAPPAPLMIEAPRAAAPVADAIADGAEDPYAVELSVTQPTTAPDTPTTASVAATDAPQKQAPALLEKMMTALSLDSDLTEWLDVFQISSENISRARTAAELVAVESLIATHYRRCETIGAFDKKDEFAQRIKDSFKRLRTMIDKRKETIQKGA